MVSTPMLALLDFVRPFVVEIDASGVDLGAVLMQDQHFIAYFSQVLGLRARAKLLSERNLMAIKW